MSSTASNIDEDIRAAFGPQSAPTPSTSHVDADIAAAFADSGTRDDGQPRTASFGTQIGHAAMDVAGSFAHGVGTLVDVGRNVGRTFGDKPTIPYGSPESTAAQLSKPFEHAPDYEAPDVKEQIRRELPKLGDQSAVKRALDTPLGQTIASDVVKPAADIGQAALTGAGAVGAVRGLAGGSGTAPMLSAQEIVDRSTAGQSMGAASATHDIQAISPELQQAVVDAARKTGGAVNPNVLRNHIEAEEHGVQLMKGQATRDADQFTEEQNSTHPDITARLNAQEGQMVNALDTVRRDASPTNVANSARENGQVALDDLKNYDAPKVKAINAAYADANDSNIAAGKGALKLDPNPGVQHAVQTLEDREELLPSEGQSILTKMKQAADSGQGIPLKQAETWKTIISRASRKYDRAGDTNAVNALSDFRDSLEQMAPTDAAAGVQQKFNAARALAKQRFDEIDADPAYKAAVNDTAKVGEPSPLADTFLDDYALSKGAAKSQLDLMIGKLSDEGRGAVASHTLSAVRKSAVSANGKISPNGFNSALNKYGDKLDSLVQPETQDSLESLGRVITNAKAEPPGGKVNYSRSGVIARDALQSAAEGLANAKTGGGYGIIKKMLNTSENSFAKDALRPGAGLEQLTEKP